MDKMTPRKIIYIYIYIIFVGCVMGVVGMALGIYMLSTSIFENAVALNYAHHDTKTKLLVWDDPKACKMLYGPKYTECDEQGGK